MAQSAVVRDYRVLETRRAGKPARPNRRGAKGYNRLRRGTVKVRPHLQGRDLRPWVRRYARPRTTSPWSSIHETPDAVESD